MRHFLFAFIITSIVFLPFFGTEARDVTDRFRSELWYLDKMSAPEAWEVETGSEETIVAVLDAGFDVDHEDLVNQYWHNGDEVADNGRDEDNNGYEDDVVGWDFVDGDPDPSPGLGEGVSDTVASHGTVIAGIIGATANNGLGITGINWDVSVMPLRVLNEFGAGSTTDVRRALVYAVENGADVINLSFTFSQADERLRETIEWAYDQGVVIVAAVGNGNIDTDLFPIYPACFDSEVGKNVVIGVSATNQDDQKADFSNFGTRCTDIAAPGVDIFASVYHDARTLEFITAYASPWEGTSLATPMVSGAAALLRSAYPSLTPDQVRHVLKLSVDPVAETSLEARKQLGAGRVNLSRALMYAASFAGTTLGSMSDSSVQPSKSFVVSQGFGSQSTVRRMNGSGDILAEFDAYDSGFHGGVRLAVGDVDGDGEEEIITGAGPGGGPQVRIFDLNGNVNGQFFAFDEGQRMGIFVVAGDVNADGVDEILVTSDEGGTGQVRIFNRYGHLKGAFFPHGRTTSAVRLALGNMDEDSESEIISVLATDGNGIVMIHDGTGRYAGSFTTFDGSVRGLSVASIDANGDGQEEILVASGKGYIPSVTVYNQSGSLLQTFFVFPHEYRGGVELAAGDIDGNGKAEMYVSPASQGGPQVRIFNREAELIGGFFAFDSSNRFGTISAIY
ncbi:S8 family serine peptidase [Candidatus Uhrbacteria bacterium]|nr:S8 family serine peptidase [Candidatus Uhrbacteria bacterium]